MPKMQEIIRTGQRPQHPRQRMSRRIPRYSGLCRSCAVPPNESSFGLVFIPAYKRLSTSDTMACRAVLDTGPLSANSVTRIFR